MAWKHDEYLLQGTCPGSALHGAKEARLWKSAHNKQAGESLSADAVRPASAQGEYVRDILDVKASRARKGCNFFPTIVFWSEVKISSAGCACHESHKKDRSGPHGHCSLTAPPGACLARLRGVAQQPDSGRSGQVSDAHARSACDG